MLGGTPALGAFVSEPTDAQLNVAGCRCLDAELLCDRKAHCRNGSDEWPDTCAHWNAFKTCRSSDFTCATGLAARPQPGRRSFCIPKKSRCDAATPIAKTEATSRTAHLRLSLCFCLYALSPPVRSSPLALLGHLISFILKYKKNRNLHLV